jgi:transcriptional regulator EpsA
MQGSILTVEHDAATRDARMLPSLLINLDASLRVHARVDLFTWTQGLLQSLIQHKALICVLADDPSGSFRVDSFSTLIADPAILGKMLLQDPAIVEALIKTWKQHQFLPVTCAADDIDAAAVSGFARQLASVGARELLVHGTYDNAARVRSLFLFACQARYVSARELYVTQLVVPFLHEAWVRSEVRDIEIGNGVAGTGVGVRVLTTREREILRWVYLGKSNAEVAAILGISPLTVKNHVQKILRKLNVVNRAQAVGRALDARIISSNAIGAPRMV